jgi:hypothetical protein
MQTATQICALARSIAKVAGYTVQSGQFLNLTLDDLVLHRDLKMNRVATTITVASGTNGPFTLQTDYLRTYDLFYQQNGLTYFLNPISQEEYDAEFKAPQVGNYPYEFTTDLSPTALDPAQPGQLFIYPQTNGALTLQHRYMIRRAQITSPESSSTIPWFPDQDYLIHATAMRLMKITDDARYAQYVTEGENMLRTHIIMEGDEQKVVKEVRLDPRRFHMRRFLKPTKVTN